MLYDMSMSESNKYENLKVSSVPTVYVIQEIAGTRAGRFAGRIARLVGRFAARFAGGLAPRLAGNIAGRFDLATIAPTTLTPPM